LSLFAWKKDQDKTDKIIRERLPDGEQVSRHEAARRIENLKD